MQASWMAKIIIITSDHLRHKFFVNTLKDYHKVLGVVSESKPIASFGLHSHSHLSTAELSDKEADREVRLCKKTIEEIVSGEIICLSYPFGYMNSVSLREEKIAKAAGLIFCFTMEMCFNRDVNIASHLFERINNNEAMGNRQTVFKYVDDGFVITDENRMKYHRSRYYSDCPNSMQQS